MVNIRMKAPTIPMQNAPDLAPRILVIGVGGAGGNAVNNMISEDMEGCEFLVCNTDSQALRNSLSPNIIQLGEEVTGGLGAGSRPEIGKAAAEESLEELMQHLDGANMAFVTAGMGGGTGTGAAPVIARACRERGILTVGVVTKPFHFEGTHRMKMAEEGIEEMQDYVDTLIVIPNQNLFRVANEKTTFADAFRMADSVLRSGVRGVTDLMVRPGLVNLDFADIRTAMQEMGKAMMGTGEADGEKRAVQSAEAAINNPLLDDVSMKGARGVIINVTGGYDMTLFEADEACNRIRDEVDPNANIIFGATFDESLEGVMRVSVVATGIEKEIEAKRKDTRSKSSGTTGPNSGPGGPGGGKFERAQPSTQNTAPIIQQGNPPLQNRSGHPIPAAPVTPAGQPAFADAKGGAAEMQTAEADMFEQSRFTEMQKKADKADEVSVPKNTALRGERYKDSFIPPRPAENVTYADNAVEPQMTGVTVPYQAGNVARDVQQQQQRSAPAVQQPMGSSLQLNPPKTPQPSERKRSMSLFERITDTVQQHLDSGRREERPAQQRRAPSTDMETVGMQAQQRREAPPVKAPMATAPAQGSLNIASPSAPPAAESSDGDLDIPAFLRRQAN